MTLVPILYYYVYAKLQVLNSQVETDRKENTLLMMEHYPHKKGLPIRKISAFSHQNTSKTHYLRIFL